MSERPDLYAACIRDEYGRETFGRFKTKEECDAFTKDKPWVSVARLTPISREALERAMMSDDSEWYAPVHQQTIERGLKEARGRIDRGDAEQAKERS